MGLPSGLDQNSNAWIAALYDMLDKRGHSSTIADLEDVALNNNAQTVIAAADATRHEIIITASLANTVAVRIGKVDTVSATRGAPLYPGNSITLVTSAAVNGFAAIAGQSVSVVMTKD